MIASFSEKYRFLSNFHPSRVRSLGLIFPTVEHAYQAAKTHDLTVHQRIQKIPTPGRAKRVGRMAILRSDWNDIKLDVMLTLLQKKFSLPALATQLLATEDEELVEGNDWGDTFWGIDSATGKGENHLGRLLMQVRDECRDTRRNEMSSMPSQDLPPIG